MKIYYQKKCGDITITDVDILKKYRNRAKRVGCLDLSRRLKNKVGELRNKKQEQDKDKNLLETKEKDVEILEIRAKLKNGQVERTQIPEFVEKFSDTAKGVVLLAEIHMKFGQPKLAQNVIRAFKAANKETMSPKERKIINSVFELVSAKGNKVPNRDELGKIDRFFDEK